MLSLRHMNTNIIILKPLLRAVRIWDMNAGSAKAAEIFRKEIIRPAKGHNYKAVTIREATCKQGGLKLWLCSDCGDFYEETTPLAAHSYKTVKHNPTCRMTGYTEHICEVCGDNYITDITPIISHAYEHITKEPTCTEKGYPTYLYNVRLSYVE